MATPDLAARVRLVEPSGPPRGCVLVVHSWWGLTESFVRYADQLRAAGFRVALPDLFDGAIATTESEAHQLRSRRRPVPHYRVLQSALQRLRADDGGPTAVVGFSMGGHWAAWLCAQGRYRLDAAIVYYAARAGEFDPAVDWQAHFADSDPWVSPSARRRMEAALRRSGCPYRAFGYPGVGHWFAESDRAESFDPDAAELALRRDLDFLSHAVAVA